MKLSFQICHNVASCVDCKLADIIPTDKYVKELVRVRILKVVMDYPYTHSTNVSEAKKQIIIDTMSSNMPARTMSFMRI